MQKGSEGMQRLKIAKPKQLNESQESSTLSSQVSSHDYFLQFRPPLQNHWANFYQTLFKALFDKGIKVLIKEFKFFKMKECTLIPREIIEIN